MTVIGQDTIDLTMGAVEIKSPSFGSCFTEFWFGAWRFKAEKGQLIRFSVLEFAVRVGNYCYGLRS